MVARSPLGSAASGIVAISSGGGGIVKNDAPATTVTNGGMTSWTAGTSVGANTDSDAPATDGAAVTITNSGSITTGDGLRRRRRLARHHRPVDRRQRRHCRRRQAA